MFTVVTVCYIILLKISGSKFFKSSFMKELYTSACINPQIPMRKYVCTPRSGILEDFLQLNVARTKRR